MEKVVFPLPATPHIKMTNPGSGLNSDRAASSVSEIVTVKFLD